MTDTEKAIWVYENANIIKPSEIRKGIKPLIDKAIEKDKGCKWCDYFSKTENIISVGNGQYKEIPHKYCGKCGRKLEE